VDRECISSDCHYFVLFKKCTKLFKTKNNNNRKQIIDLFFLNRLIYQNQELENKQVVKIADLQAHSSACRSDSFTSLGPGRHICFILVCELKGLGTTALDTPLL